MNTIIKTATVLAVCLIFLLSAGCGGVDSSRFQILDFNGHSYVAYDGNNYDSGLLHNPDCICGWQSR